MDPHPHIARWNSWHSATEQLQSLTLYRTELVRLMAGPRLEATPGRIRITLARADEDPVVFCDEYVDLAAGDHCHTVGLVVRDTILGLPAPVDGRLEIRVIHGHISLPTGIVVQVGLSDAPAMAWSQWRTMARHWRQEARRQSLEIQRMFHNASDVIHASAQTIRAAGRAGAPPPTPTPETERWAALFNLAAQLGVGEVIKNAVAAHSQPPAARADDFGAEPTDEPTPPEHDAEEDPSLHNEDLDWDDETEEELRYPDLPSFYDVACSLEPLERTSLLQAWRQEASNTLASKKDASQPHPAGASLRHPHGSRRRHD